MPHDIFETPPLAEGTVATFSRLKAFWLRHARGYEIASMHHIPKQSMLGSLYYKTQWILHKKQ